MLNVRKSLIFSRAGSRARTDDLLITNQLLYQLSYAGLSDGCEKNHISAADGHDMPPNPHGQNMLSNSAPGDPQPCKPEN